MSSLDKGEVAAGEEVRDVEGCLVDKTCMATVSAQMRLVWIGPRFGLLEAGPRLLDSESSQIHQKTSCQWLE